MPLLRIVVILLFVSGCTHQPMGWERTRMAAKHAAAHPATWAPLLGASVFALDDYDNKAADSLANHNPLFGSQDRAGDVSDDLKSTLIITAGISALMVPESSDQNAFTHRGEHLAVAIGGISMTRSLTEEIKDIVKRERPNQENDKSFPSGHASQAFSAATFASENFHERWGDTTATAWADATLYTAAGLTAWARVEAEKHHPADVLVGASLGNFIARFLDELLLSDEQPATLSMYTDRHSLFVGVQYPF